ADCEAMVEQAAQRLGGVSILVNNAAASHGADRAPLTDVPLSAWSHQLDVNVTGTFLMTRLAVPHLARAGSGRIVNVSSVAALLGAPRRAAYAASKAAIIGFTRAAAADLAPHGITVNAVCPGAVSTQRARSTAAREHGASAIEGGMAERAASIPLGRLGVPD